MIIQTYYISSGAKNAMYTLRVHRSGSMTKDVYVPETDFYMGNLSTDPDKAEAKAKEFFDRLDLSVMESETFKVNFAGFADFELNTRVGKLSVKDTMHMHKIESEIFPFGKHIDKRFCDVPESYILWFADQLHKNPVEVEERPVFGALCAACQGFALEAGYIKKREEVRNEKRLEDLKSVHYGFIGDRLTLQGEVISSYTKPNDFMQPFTITKIRVENNIFVYIGKEFGAKGEIIKFKGTIVSHDTYDGINTTRINRPVILKD